MKYSKRLGSYYAANCSFDPKSCQAHSYGWWRFVARIKGKVVFNGYRYSNTTSGHQRKVRSLLRELGIRIDREVSISGGLQNISTLTELNKLEKQTAQRIAEREEAKRVARLERAKIRRAEKRAKLDAEFKTNVEKITHEDVLEFRAAKAVQS